MLVLTRKSGESIVIGEDIEITVVSVEGEAVRLGIRAPREVPVYRSEICEEIRLENLRALRSAGQLQEDLRDALPRPPAPPEPDRDGAEPGEKQ